MTTITTNYWQKPIPDRRWDWSAVDDSRYEPGEPIGYGATKEEAITDLLAQMAERSPLANVPMPWCERCQGWHHETADHVRGGSDERDAELFKGREEFKNMTGARVATQIMFGFRAERARMSL